MKQISLVIYSERPDFVSRIEHILEDVECVHLTGCVADLEEYDRLRKSEEALAILVDLSPDPDQILDEIESLTTLPPFLFVAGPQHESTVILRAMRLGVREFFPEAPSAVELETAFRAGLASMPVQAESNNDARVIGVMGAKGGVGATTVACQIGFALREMGQRTAIIDLNLPLGDVALHCDVTPVHTLADMVTDGASADATYIAKLLNEHRSGLQIMASPHRIEDAEAITADHVGAVLQLLRDQFDFIVLDVSRSWNEVSIRALDLSDLIVAVSVVDLPALGHLKQHLALLERLGHKQKTVRLVANRYSTQHNSLDKKDFSDFIGREIDFTISNDFSTVAAAIDAGSPVSKAASGAPIVKEFEALARQIHVWCGLGTEPCPSVAAPTGLRRFFRRQSR
jgi:pilus assembly protein CpaE